MLLRSIFGGPLKIESCMQLHGRAKTLEKVQSLRIRLEQKTEWGRWVRPSKRGVIIKGSSGNRSWSKNELSLWHGENAWRIAGLQNCYNGGDLRLSIYLSIHLSCWGWYQKLDILGSWWLGRNTRYQSISARPTTHIAALLLYCTVLYCAARVDRCIWFTYGNRSYRPGWHSCWTYIWLDIHDGHGIA